jgi:23S rRNA U2552 (ribose-2'-O)-methylase RlmE/FtsJ
MEIFLNEPFSFYGSPLSIIKYNSFCELKNNIYGNFEDLDNTKARIDTLDRDSERCRRAAAKYIHEYELVKLLCKKQVISRAYFKLYEIIYFEPIILNNRLDCFFICEAPGGFIECISDIRRKKNLRTNFISISKDDPFIKYDSFIEENNLMYGDITKLDVLKDTVNSVLKRFPEKLDLVTADGGFDIKLFNAQEILSTKLLFCEIYLALQTQKIGGMFVIKFFDMFTHNSMVYYHILSLCYNSVKIIKPKTSRNCNSERYIVCYNFKGIIVDIPFEEIINSFVLTQSEYTLIYPNTFTSISFNKKIRIFNNLVLYEQIKTINESIKMVNKRDTYYQHMILNIFKDKFKCKSEKLSHIYFFKNILYSRIKKCTDFLRKYNINTNQIVYYL